MQLHFLFTFGLEPDLDSSLRVQTMAAEDIFKTIARGRFNTAMPAWSKEDIGPLSDYQIGQLVLLAQQGDWPATQSRVVNLGLAPLVPFAAQPDPAILEQVKALPNGAQLAEGITLFAENCVACHGADGLGTAIAPALNDAMPRARTADEIQAAALTALILGWERIPQGAIPAPDRPVPVTEESLALGSQLFSQYCTRCHGPEGQGTRRAPAINVQSVLTTTNDAALQQIITSGVPGTAMPAWGDRMTDAEIQAIVGFIRAWEPTAPEVATPAQAMGGPWWAANTGGAPQLPGGGVSANAAQTRGSGNPPWAQTPAWSSLDWQAYILFAGLLAAALLMIGVALAGLRPQKV